jgi:hypothetical protein
VRLIQKIYEIDPLVCPKCKGAMRVINNIEDPSLLRAILDHLGISLVRSGPPPKVQQYLINLINSTNPESFLIIYQTPVGGRSTILGIY